MRKLSFLILFLVVFIPLEGNAVDYTITYEIHQLKENQLPQWGLSVSGIYEEVTEDYYTKSFIIRLPFNAMRIERKYKAVTLKEPMGELGLELISFPYGGLTNIENKKSVAHSIKVLSNIPYMVCAEPGELTENAMEVIEGIINRVKIFGYVDTGGKPPKNLDIIKQQIDRISDNNWYGVFLDCFGYDFGETRKRQNEIIDYAHEKGLHCFANAWFIEDALGNKIDEVHNPKGEETHLTKGDWYLMESFLMSNSGYAKNMESIFEKLMKGQYYKKELGINIACLSYKRDSVAWKKAWQDIQASYFTALFSGFDGWWFTDRLEDASFIYAKAVNLDVGNVIKKELTEYNEGLFITETDKYIVILNRKKYPALSYSFYEL